MFDWLAFGWNLAMLVSGAFLVSQTFRRWPLRWTRRSALLHMVLAVLTAYIMKAYPAPLVHAGGDDWAAGFANLHYSPLMGMLLAYGPLWALATSVLMLLPDLLVALLTHRPELIAAPLIAGVGVVLLGALLGTPLSLTRFQGREAVWRLPLVLLPIGVPYLLHPGGAAGWWAAALLLLSNLVGFVAGASVNRSRFKLLAVSSRLSRQAHTDALTGLWNRRQFETDLEALPLGGWVLVIDLDHFKTINDRFGHDVGDEYLVGAAAALNRSLTGSERAYRLGGEEFALLLGPVQPGTPDAAGGAQAVAGAVLAHMREVSHRSNPGRPLSCSVGMAQLLDNETPHAALRRADLALFRAKASGRDRAEVAGGAAELQVSQGQDIRALEPLFWEALHSSISLAAIDRDLTDEEWTRLLQIAILSVPHAEMGSIDVRQGEFFVQRAQVGYSDNLLGLRYSRTEQLHWYGLGEKNWLRGQPRIMVGPEIAQRSSMPIPEHSHVEEFERDGRIHELKVTLCMPLLMDGEVVAHLNLDRVSDSRPFDEQDLRIARAFADQVTVLTVAARRREAWSRMTQSRPAEST